MLDTSKTTAGSPESFGVSDQWRILPEDIGAAQAWLELDRAPGEITPYQLLRIAPDEESLKKIQVAVARQRQLLESRRETADPQVWERLSFALESAVLAITDNKRRAIVDARLRRRASAGVRRGLDHGAPITCVGCQHSNQSTASFCVKCGADLWTQCPKCDTPTTRDTSFCGSCGVQMEQALSEIRNSFAGQLDAARELLSQRKFRAAREALYQLATTGDHRLDALVEQAVQVWQSIDRVEVESVDDREHYKGLAREALKAHKFREALKYLEAIPEALEDDETLRMRRDAAARVQEVRKVSARVKQLVEQRQFDAELASLVEVAHKLQPGNENLVKIAQLTRKQLLTRCQAEFAKGNYGGALKALDAIPQMVRDDAWTDLWKKFSEYDWMLSDLKHSPYVDPELVRIAKRFHKEQPDHPRSAQIVKEVEKRRAAGSTSSVPVWSRATTARALFPELRWEAGFDTIELPEALAPAESTRLWGAVGAALCGLDAAIKIPLHQKKQNVLFSNLSFSRGKKGPATAWGLDLGTFTIKAVRLQQREDGEGYLVTKAVLADDPHAKSVEQDYEARKEFLTEKIQELAIPKDEPVFVVLPGRDVLGKFVQLPPSTEKQRKTLIPNEAAHQMPVPLDELEWGHHYFEPEDDRLGGTAFVVAAKKPIVAALVELCQQTGVEVHSVIAEPVALYNFAARELLPHAEVDEPLMVLDVGETATLLLAASTNGVWFRTVPFSANVLRRGLTREFQLTHDQAQQVLIHPSRARRLSDVYGAWDPAFENFSVQLTRSLTGQDLDGVRLSEVEKVYLAGGGAMVHGLCRRLRVGD